ncbi:thioredoxin family protein [Campylobacter sp. MIT 12-8780]|uniref:thioredoxin family protein n=1 Tax=unclassified Campylobacter TaxID=2593542 RepID=UPI00115CB1A0|nr:MULTISPECIES: thioredoxin family protein [unclassified Campylobacter]NDJ27700.1 thioredoxin family protein [Campylobacter sp. MIT 19-121]TQR40864.1 thioredoxin family protein [Campylobacter sp. MIT 12-8780]
MKKKILAIFISLVLGFLNLNAKTYNNIYDAAIQAQSEAKLMIFFVLSDTCQFCHKLMNDISSNQALLSYLDENFIVATTNLNADDGVIPRDLLFNGVTPTTYILTPTGKVIGQPIEGAIDSNMLLGLIKGLEEYKKQRLGF